MFQPLDDVDYQVLESNLQARPLSVRDYFPHRTCVNLDRRADRWEAVQDQFRQVGLDPVKRFSACDGETMDIPAGWRFPRGAYGCLASHLEIVRQAKAEGHAHVLILEDDVVFAPDLVTRLPQIMAALPEDWDMLFFGGSHEEAPVPVAHELYRMTKTYTTHAYVLNHTIYDAFIERNSLGLEPVDVTNSHLQQCFNTYVTMPHLAWQVDGWSDIIQSVESNWSIRESQILFGPHMDRLLEGTALIIAYQQEGDLSRQNLDYVLNYYHRSMPTIEILVVASEGALTTPLLGDFRLITCLSSDRETLFRQGAHHARQRSFFIFSDAAVTPSRVRHTRANLLMCERHGNSTFFDTLVALSPADSELVRNDRLAEVCLTPYAPEPLASAEEGAFMLSGEVLSQRMDQSITSLADLTMFRPENRGMRLSSERP